MTNVVMLTNSLSHSGGGVSGVVRDLAGALQDKSLSKVSAVGVINKRQNRDTLDFGAVPVCQLSGYGPSSFGYAPGMVRRLLDISPGVVHTHGVWGYTSLASLRWSNKTGGPYIVSPHGMLNEWAINLSKVRKKVWLKTVEGLYLRRASCLIALNEHEATSIRQLGFTTPIAIIPNGIRIPDQLPRGRPDWKEVLPADAQVLLFLSRLHPKKGIELLLDAWKKVADDKSTSKWFLIIAGWGDDRYVDMLSMKVKQLGLSERVMFVGPQFDDGKFRAFRAADGYVLPSYGEGLPLAVLEAWALGVPVLMSDFCNLTQSFEKGAALRVTLNVDSMAQEIKKFIELPRNKRDLLSDRAKDLVGEDYNWDHIALDVSRVYRWVTGTGRKPIELMFD